jgi:hypothetical protein
MSEHKQNTLAMVRQVLKNIVPEHDIQLRRALRQSKRETPRLVQVRVSTLYYGMPDAEWERHRERMAQVRDRLTEAGLLHAPHCDVVLVLNDTGIELKECQGRKADDQPQTTCS